MEETKKDNQEVTKNAAVCGKGCSCGCCSDWMHGHRAFRIVFAVVILLIVFWIGVKVGEVKEAVLLNTGSDFRANYSNEYNQGGRMMNGNNNGGYAVPANNTSATSSVQSAPSAPAQR